MKDIYEKWMRQKNERNKLKNELEKVVVFRE